VFRVKKKVFLHFHNRKRRKSGWDLCECIRRCFTTLDFRGSKSFSFISPLCFYIWPWKCSRQSDDGVGGSSGCLNNAATHAFQGEKVSKLKKRSYV